MSSNALIANKGFEGVIQGATLPDLIQMECLAMTTRAVRVYQGELSGRIFFSGGQIVHAEVGKLQAEEALFVMLCWHTGGFTIEEGVRCMDDTISRDWQGLLMEAAHRADESQTPSFYSMKPTIPLHDPVDDVFNDSEVTSGVKFNSEGTLLKSKGDNGEELQATFAYLTQLLQLIGGSLGAEDLREIHFTCEKERVLCVLKEGETTGLVATPKANFPVIVKKLL